MEVTREEARKLIGGYAAGSLTESERTSLFAAALDDQELFEELAGEHSMKELIDSPGARDRLVAALTPVAQEPRRVLWPWAAALACGIAAATVWVMLPRQVEAPAQVAETTVPVHSEPAPVAVPATPPQVEKAAKPRAAAPKPATPIPAPAAPPPPPPAAEPAIIAQSDTLLKTESESRIVRGAPAAGIAMAKGGAGIPFLANQAAAVATQPLTYEFTASRALRIVPAQAGVLQVTVGLQTIFARNPVVERTPIEVAVPNGAVSVRIEFTPTGGTAFVVIPSVPQ